MNLWSLWVIFGFWFHFVVDLDVGSDRNSVGDYHDHHHGGVE